MDANDNSNGNPMAILVIRGSTGICFHEVGNKVNQQHGSDENDSSNGEHGSIPVSSWDQCGKPPSSLQCHYRHYRACHRIPFRRDQ